MRKEPYGIGSFVHVVKRGARGLPFLKDDQDYHRLLLMFAHFNDSNARPLWVRDLMSEKKIYTFERADSWEEKIPLTKVHAFLIHANHFHLLLEETTENGITKFMKKVGNGLAGYLNEKYNEYGSPFQGAFKSKTIDNDVYLKYVFAYIQVKNALERFPGGYVKAMKNFEKAYNWCIDFQFGSLYDHITFTRSDLHKVSRGIVSNDPFIFLWPNPEEFKKFAEDVIKGRAYLDAFGKDAFSGAFS